MEIMHKATLSYMELNHKIQQCLPACSVRIIRPAPREIEHKRTEFRGEQIEARGTHLERNSSGQEIVGAIKPILKKQLECLYRTQILLGIGCFGRNLCRIGCELTTGCHHCSVSADETTQHTLEICPACSSERRAVFLPRQQGEQHQLT